LPSAASDGELSGLPLSLILLLATAFGPEPITECEIHSSCESTGGCERLDMGFGLCTCRYIFNPAHVPCWWMNNPTLGLCCEAMIGRADIEESKSTLRLLIGFESKAISAEYILTEALCVPSALDIYSLYIALLCNSVLRYGLTRRLVSHVFTVPCAFRPGHLCGTQRLSSVDPRVFPVMGCEVAQFP
jgi:hypothetical protein